MTGTEKKPNDFYFFRPTGARKFHIFSEHGDALCLSYCDWGHSSTPPRTPVVGNEEYNAKRDCKKCFDTMKKILQKETKK